MDVRPQLRPLDHVVAFLLHALHLVDFTHRASVGGFFKCRECAVVEFHLAFLHDLRFLLHVEALLAHNGIFISEVAEVRRYLSTLHEAGVDVARVVEAYEKPIQPINDRLGRFGKTDDALNFNRHISDSLIVFHRISPQLVLV